MNTRGTFGRPGEVKKWRKIPEFRQKPKWKLTRNGSRKTNMKFTDFEEKTKKQKRFSLIKEIIRNKKLPHF